MMNKIDPGLIGFDIDGVVADTGRAFIRIAGEEYGLHNISLDDITSFEVMDCLDVSRNIVEKIFTRLLDDPLDAGLQPMEDAISVLHRLAEKAPLTFVTARPFKDPIARWLNHFLKPTAFANMRLVAMGEHDNKTSYIKNLGLEYFVDDRLQTCEKLASEGITPLVFQQPWNKKDHNLPTVADWQTIQALCFE
jgi:uncharacterized HAD superfamily protein